MIRTVDPGRYFHVESLDPDEIQKELHEAIELARVGAEKEGWMGVLVTRHGPDLYTVSLSETVHYGAIAERHG